MYWFFSAASRSKELTARYGARAEPPGTRLTRQTIKVGPVRWRFCVTVVLSPQGLFLHPQPFLGGLLGGPRPILVPWADIGRPRQGHLYLGWQAVELSVGEPEIVPVTFTSGVYEQMRGYLFPAAAAGPR